CRSLAHLGRGEVLDACPHGGGDLHALALDVVVPLEELVEVVAVDVAGADSYGVGAVVDGVVDGVLVAESGANQGELVWPLGDGLEHVPELLGGGHVAVYEVDLDPTDAELVGELGELGDVAG